jgi:hypothetical protein
MEHVDNSANNSVSISKVINLTEILQELISGRARLEPLVIGSKALNCIQSCSHSIK